MKRLGVLLIGILFACAVAPTASGKAEEAYSKPQVGLTSYHLENEAIVLGEDNTVVLEISNFSKEIPVTDVLVSFSSGNHSVVPVYGKTNQLYFSKIKENGKVKAELPINIVYQENGYATMSFAIQYYAGNTLLSNDSSYIVIPVNVEEKLEVENVSVSSNAQVNSKVSLLIGYKNSSETELKNLCLVIGGDAFSTPIELPVKETLAAGERGYFEYYLAFDTVGNKLLDLELKGYDEAGNEYSVDCGGHSVRVTGDGTANSEVGITENDEKEPGSINPGEAEKSALNVYLVIGAIAAVIVICLLIGAVSSKKRGK